MFKYDEQKMFADCCVDETEEMRRNICIFVVHVSYLIQLQLLSDITLIPITVIKRCSVTKIYIFL